MEDYIQFSAKTKNEAITKACLELGTSSDQLDIQVISEGSSGFFGIGSKPAVIKVRRIEPVSDMQEIDELVESVKLDAIKEEKKLEKPFTPDVKKESAPKAAPAEEKKPVKKEAVQVEKASEEAPAKAAAPKERPARDFQGKAKPAREKQPRAPKERQPKETRERAPKQGRPIEILSDPEKIREVEERAVVFLRDVFGSMDLGEVEITSKYNTADGSLDVDFEGEDMGILIGKRGQTLDSLQYLTSLVVNKGESTYIRVKLDTEDYRRRRKETLENLARGIAFKVKKTRKPVVLEPMNPYERRIIHATVATVEGATSSSIGEEPNRRVVISSTNPVKKYNNNYKGKKKPYNNGKGGYRQNSRRPQGEGKNQDGQEKKPYVFRPNNNGKDEGGENRRRPPRQNSYNKERCFEEKPAASNENIRSEVPRSTAPSEAQDKPLYAKIDLE